MVFKLWTKQRKWSPSSLAMFGNLINGRQNAVWHLALDVKIPQNYEDRSNQSKK